jgi:hypothetical protein
MNQADHGFPMHSRPQPADRPERPPGRVTLLGAGLSLLVVVWIVLIPGALPPILFVPARSPGPLGMLGTVVCSLMALTVLAWLLVRGSWGQRILAVLLSPPPLVGLGFWVLWGLQGILQ